MFSLCILACASETNQLTASKIAYPTYLAHKTRVQKKHRAQEGFCLRAEPRLYYVSYSLA